MFKKDMFYKRHVLQKHICIHKKTYFSHKTCLRNQYVFKKLCKKNEHKIKIILSPTTNIFTKKHIFTK